MRYLGSYSSQNAGLMNNGDSDATKSLVGDAEVFYYEQFLSSQQSEELFGELEGLLYEFEQDILLADGQVIPMLTPKLIFADHGITSDMSLHGKTIPWPQWMTPLRQQIERHTGKTYEVCVCIYYADGIAHVDWHADLAAFGDTSSIPSLSLGGTRVFGFRRDDRETPRLLDLPSGSMVLMGAGFQERYQHALLPSEEDVPPRFNLTFRTTGRH